MISLSSIVKSGSFHIYSHGEDSGEGWVEESDRHSGEFDKIREYMLEQALRKSKHIYDEAVKRANAIIENAKEEGKSLKIEAEQRGYQEGYTRGVMDGAGEARKSSEEGLKELEELTRILREERLAAFERQKQDILDIAFEIAKKIMKQHITTDENAVIKMLEDFLQDKESGVKIYLSEYSKVLNVAMDKDIVAKIRKVSKNARVVVTENEELMMVETDSGMVDMSIPTQLKQLREALDNEQ